MRISIFGMGYVGIVSAACLARDGHQIVGIDPNLTKVELVNSGQTPIIEQDMPEMVKAAVDAGRLTASNDDRRAIMNTDLSLVCVGTPSRDNGSLDLRHVQNVCRQIGEALRDKKEFEAAETSMPCHKGLPDGKAWLDRQLLSLIIAGYLAGIDETAPTSKY